MPDLTIELRKSCPSGRLCRGEHTICLIHGTGRRCVSSDNGVFQFPQQTAGMFNVTCDGKPTNPGTITVPPVGMPLKMCVTSDCCD